MDTNLKTKYIHFTNAKYIKTAFTLINLRSNWKRLTGEIYTAHT